MMEKAGRNIKLNVALRCFRDIGFGWQKEKRAAKSSEAARCFFVCVDQ